MATYVLPDEPRANAFADYAVNPMVILFSAMMVGPTLAWPWFVFNHLAVGPSGWVRTLGLVGLGAAVTVGTATALVLVEGPLWTGFDYLRIALAAFKLGIAYAIYARQAIAFELFTHFGGRTRNGLFLVGAGFVANLLVNLLAGGLWAPLALVVWP